MLFARSGLLGGTDDAETPSRVLFYTLSGLLGGAHDAETIVVAVIFNEGRYMGTPVRYSTDIRLTH